MVISVSPIVIWAGGILVIALHLLLNGYKVPKERAQKITGWACVVWAVAAVVCSVVPPFMAF